MGSTDKSLTGEYAKRYAFQLLMKNKDKIKRISNAIEKVSKAEDKRRLKTIERIWVQDTPKLHVFNYWYYRYFTNELILYILDAIKFRREK